MTLCFVRGCLEGAKTGHFLMSANIVACDEHTDAARTIVQTARNACSEIVEQALQDIRALGSKRGMVDDPA